MNRPFLAGLGLMVAIMAAPATATAENDALDHIIKAGTVRIAVPENFAPFGALGAEGKLQGYDIDTAALVAEALKVKLDLVTVSSNDRIPYLADGKVDLVISSLGKDAEREKVIDFSISYAPFFSGVFGPAELEISSPEDLVGKTIAVTRDTIEDTVLTKLAPATATINRYDDNADTEVAFLFDKSQLIATGYIVAAKILTRSPLKKMTTKFLLRNSPCYIGVRKGETALLARINEIIAAARKDGSLNRISEHWLKAPLGDPEHPDLIGTQ
jgi:polar amino acid transport system substrate-binding protein